MMPALEREARSRSPNDVDRYVGCQLRKFRGDDNLTLQELAHDLGMSHQQLQKYETGTNRISAGVLHAVAARLRRPVTAFFPDGEGAADTALRLAQAERRLAKIRAALGER
jgi:transcriptional regulator with XRE-family HTH domain